MDRLNQARRWLSVPLIAVFAVTACDSGPAPESSPRTDSEPDSSRIIPADQSRVFELVRRGLDAGPPFFWGGSSAGCKYHIVGEEYELTPQRRWSWQQTIEESACPAGAPTLGLQRASGSGEYELRLDTVVLRSGGDIVVMGRVFSDSLIIWGADEEGGRLVYRRKP